jgi:hypothetical protein
MGGTEPVGDLSERGRAVKGLEELALKRTAGNLATAVIALDTFPSLEE